LVPIGINYGPDPNIMIIANPDIAANNLTLNSKIILHFSCSFKLSKEYVSMKSKFILCMGLLLIAACNSKDLSKTGDILEKQQFTKAESPEKVGFSSERLARIDTFFGNYIKTGQMPNAEIFIARHGKIVYYKTFGWRNISKKEVLQKDDIFRIASQSKAIITVGLMRLYEEGKFLLDDPISTYIPEFKNPRVLVKLDEKTGAYTARPAQREITFRHLLSHTSGIPYEYLLYAKDSIPYYNSLKPETLREVVKKIASKPLMHDPGEKFTYGLSIDVAGYLVELISGMKLDEYLKKYIFEPLAMNDSYFYLPAEKATRLVTLYEKPSADSILKEHSNKAYQYFPVSGAKTYFSGGAGLVGTIEDYAKFIQMLINGGSFNHHQILGRKTIELMTQNQIGNNEVWGNDDKFGLGFQLMTEKTTRKLPASIGSFKWGGMYATDYLIDPKEDLIFLVYTNVQPFYIYSETMEKFRVLVYQSLIGE
jgi:CubicO group peptidase (beta-lactamase class C family)